MRESESRGERRSGGAEKRRRSGSEVEVEVFKVNRRNRKDYARQPTRGGEYTVVVG